MERIFRSVLIVSAGIAASLAIAGGLVHASTPTGAPDNGSLAVESKAVSVPGWSISTPLYFEQNQGQTDPSVRYVHRSGGMTAFLRDTDVVLRIPFATEEGRSAAVTRMSFAGAQETVIVTGNDPLAGHSIYFKGSDPDLLIKDVNKFDKVK